MRSIISLLLLALVQTGLANDTPEALQEAFMAGILAGDADALAACYTDDAVNFTLDEMKGIGPESARNSWGRFFEAFDVEAAELTDQHLEVHGDTAIAWGLFHITATPKDGSESVDFRGRYMDVARNVNGQWLYVADHASMPLPRTEE